MLLKKTRIILIVISLIMLSIITTKSTVNAMSYKWAKANVNIRKKPTKKSKSVGMLYELEKVISIGTIGKWSIVEYKNKIAYIKTKYLSKKKPKYTTKNSPAGFFKSYMDYKYITDTSSPQYKMQRNKAYTDSKTGIRKVGNRFCVALGSGFANKIGTKVNIIMKSGKVIPCILADQKKNSETIAGHKMHSWDKSVAEFIVSSRRLDRRAKRMGDISYIPMFKGAIKNIRVYK